MVNGNVEEALDLCAVEIHCEDTVSARNGKQVCHKLCRDGISCLSLSVLTCISHVGDNCCDTACGSSLKCVDHNEKLHHVVVYRGAGGLNNEYVGTSNAFLNGNAYLSVGKGNDLGLTEGKSQRLCDVGSYLGIGVCSEDFDILTVKIHFSSPFL